MQSLKDLQALSEGILNTPAVEAPKGHPENIDMGIKHIDLPNEYITAILESSQLLEDKAAKKPAIVVAPTKELSEAERLEEKLTSLVERLAILLKEAKVVMNEMTSTGSIGVGTQTNLFATKKKKKKKLKTDEPC